MEEVQVDAFDGELAQESQIRLSDVELTPEVRRATP